MHQIKLGVALAALVTASAFAHPTAGDAAADPATSPPVVNVTAEDYALRAPDEIASGWTTFELANQGDEHHFLFLTRMPEGVDYDQYMVDLGVPYDEIWHQIHAGDLTKGEALEALGPMLPEWFASAVQMGGTGAVAPGLTATTTLNLVPGYYILECYMKTADGEIHATEGMARPLVVTADGNGAQAPSESFAVRLSNAGLDAPQTVSAGQHTVAVHFDEHPEFGFGYDVHLARLDEDDSIEEIGPWMDWFLVQGLRAPAPATFIGGTHEMPVGYTAYVTVDLEPGRYAWISETQPERMHSEFVVE